MRPSSDEFFLQMAELTATRGTCPRRQVGCVIINHHRHVIATGYNGTPRGFAHCTHEPCAGAHYPSGQGLEKCEAVHAEANALLQCKDVEEIHSLFCTASPCIHCTKLILNTSCKRIVFRHEYPHSDSENLWRRAGREWVHLGEKK